MCKIDFYKAKATFTSIQILLTYFRAQIYSLWRPPLIFLSYFSLHFSKEILMFTNHRPPHFQYKLYPFFMCINFSVRCSASTPYYIYPRTNKAAVMIMREWSALGRGPQKSGFGSNKIILLIPSSLNLSKIFASNFLQMTAFLL